MTNGDRVDGTRQERPRLESGIAGDDILTIGDPRLKAETDIIGDVGASVKVIVVEVRKTDVFPDRPTSPLLQMINPMIVDQSGTIETGWEGCFSVPGLMGLMPRADTITVQYTLSGWYQRRGAILWICGQGDPTRD